jgi:hypothetical protein
MSITPARYNFQVWRGATFRKTLTLHEGDKNAPVIDLTGYSATMPITSGATTLLLDNVSGITLGDGTIDLYISDETTAAISWKLGSYKLFLENPSGEKDILLYGNFSIKDTI